MLELVDGSRAPSDYFRDLKYLGAEIIFGNIGEPHQLFADAHVMPTQTVAFPNSTRRLRASIIFYIARNSESVTREGARPVVE